MSRRYLIGFILLAACRHSAYEAVARTDSSAALRTFLREHPDDENIEAATLQLSELEFAQAAKTHTILAYKRFLDEFPLSPKAPVARELLEGLRFNAATDLGTSNALRQFLRDHPNGARREEAEKLLAEFEFKEMSATSDRETLTRIIAEHRDDPRRARAEERLDDQSFVEAKSSETSKLLAYLKNFPAGAHREEVRKILLSRKLEGLLFSDMVETARAEVARSTFAESIPNLETQFANAERDAKLRRAKEPLAQAAQADNYLRSIDDLVKSLAAPDPLDRWQAAEELGQHVSTRAIDPLLESLRDARQPLIRQRAFDSLGSVLRTLPKSIADYEVAVRLESLRASASDAPVFLTIAALVDLSGQPDAAVVDYQRAFDPAAPDPVILRRLMQIRSDKKQYFSAAVAARQLALWAFEVARQAEGSFEGPALGVARHLCGAVEMSRYALEMIKGAQKEKTEFPEDLLEFEATAQNALKLAQARLDDSEAILRTQSTNGSSNVRLCGNHEISDRIAEGERIRADALRKAQTSLPKLAPRLLELARERDPSPKLRTLAAQLLARLPEHKYLRF